MAKSALHCSAALLLLAALALGQATEATLTGRITDAGTHRPIEGAQLWYQGNGSGPFVATDADGKYVLRFVPRGFGIGSVFHEGVVLTITAPGYASVGPSSSDKMLVPIQPGASETRDFELQRAGRISGHLIDRDTGKPIPGFYVQAIRRADAINGRLGFQSAPSSSDGTFTIGGLGPGGYALAIDPAMTGKLSAGEKKADDFGYGPVWFSDVPRVDMASPVVLAPGENREIEMRLHKRELHHIGGVFVASEGMESDPVYVSVTVEKGRTGVDGQLPKAGPFHIDGLGEGTYTITAGTRPVTGHDRAFVSRRVDVSDRSISDLTLTLRPGVTLHAVVKMAEKDMGHPEPLSFLPFSLDGWMPRETDQGADRLTMVGIPAGEYVPMLNNLPGCAVAAIEYSGRAVPEMVIDVQAPESTVTFVLTARPGSVTGVVRDGSGGKPLSGASVFIAPAAVLDSLRNPGRSQMMAQLRVQMATSDENGSFHVADVAPGKYRILAWPHQDGGGGGPEFSVISDAFRSGRTVDVEASQSTSIDLNAKNQP